MARGAGALLRDVVRRSALISGTCCKGGRPCYCTWKKSCRCVGLCSKQLAHTMRPLLDRFLINRWTLLSLFCLYKGVYFIPQNHAWPNFAAANMCVFVMAPLCWRGFQRCLDREGCWADGTESSLTSQQTQDPTPSPPTLLWSHFPAQTLTSFTLSSAGLSLTLSLSPPPTAAHNSTVHCSRASPPSAWPPDPTVDQQLHSHIKPGREGGGTRLVLF